MAHEGRCPKTEKMMKGVAAAPEVKAASCCTVGSEDWDPVEVDVLLEELRDIPVTPEKKGKSSKVSGGGNEYSFCSDEESERYVLTPSMKPKSVILDDAEHLQGIAIRGEVQLDEVMHKPGVVDSPVEAGNYSERTPSPYIKYLELTRHNTDTN
ncbi:UNVERIFIED_CONTAM: hypothetical protein FKN15_034525 [Acipenser sinensis]